MEQISTARKIMTEFSESTGLPPSDRPARRYLWTDAFAVCNFLALYRVTSDDTWLKSALSLVDQVHFILGRHRDDDSRSGWLSGLDETSGRQHPTRGGLRIGKTMPERGSAEPYDEITEWDKDGQYYHYLTKWMLALSRVSQFTGDPVYNAWAMELAQAAHSGFFHMMPDRTYRLYWKMSIDLSYPLVSSMGQLDPLDGLITCIRLQAVATHFPGSVPDLGPPITDLAALCQSGNWATSDPLGIGGLLTNAWMMALLPINTGILPSGLMKDLLGSSLWGLETFLASGVLKLPADHRLAFRELGLAIGLQAALKIAELLERKPDAFSAHQSIFPQIRELIQFAPIADSIEEFWLDARHRASRIWRAHRDINQVMLAASLTPDSYL